MTDRDPQAGLTYLDLLLSLALLSMMAALLAGGFTTAGRVWDRATDLALNEEEILSRRDLRRAIGFLRANQNQDLTFIGTDDAFELHGVSRTVRVRAAGVDGALALLWSDGVQSRQFASDLQSLEFSYLAAGQTGWQAIHSAEVFPGLIRIEGETALGPWPPFVIRPSEMLRQTEMSATALFPRQ